MHLHDAACGLQLDVCRWLCDDAAITVTMQISDGGEDVDGLGHPRSA